VKRERCPDVELDELIQRGVDERAEICAACEPWFDDTAVNSLADARMAGRSSGFLNHGASMNPFPERSPEHYTWNRERLAVIGARLNAARWAA